MSGRLQPGIEFLQLQTRKLLDLEDWLGVGSLKMALARATYAPDEQHAVHAPTTFYNAFDLVRPSVANQHVYEAETSGATSGVLPVFPTDGTSVQDGQVLWRDIGIAAPPPFLVLPSTTGPARVGMPSADVNDWIPNNAYSEFELARALVGAQRGYFALCTVAGTTGPGEPVWPEPGVTVVDGTATWIGVGKPGTHPISGEIEILDDPGTTVYVQSGEVITDTFTQLRGRSTILEATDYTFPTATLSAAWAIFYLNGSFTDDDDSGQWLSPIVAYSTLRDTRLNAESIAADFTVVMPAEALLRLR